MPEARAAHAMMRIAADIAVLTAREGSLQTLLVTRRNDPFVGWAALPGGFVRGDEEVDDAAARELLEETGIAGDSLHLELLALYSAPDRDPRGRVVSAAFLALAPDLPIPHAGSDAQHAYWAPVHTVRGTLAFDHDRILADAVERARSRLEYTTLATAFCGPEFTMSDLREVYEVVWDVPLDPRNFSRKVLTTVDFVQAIGRKRAPKSGRPAALYTRGTARLMHPPLLRDRDD
jgi:8-oxo-dGTP diphosphatase